MPSYFSLNQTNGIKYIKVATIDANGNDQSDYLGQLQNITLSYPDRSGVTYNIAGAQNFGTYFLYSIGPYIPGSLTNFNTSSAGDINNYSLLASKTTFSIPNGTSTTVSSYNSSTNPNGYFTASSGLYTWYQTPNPYLTFEFTASGVSMPSSTAVDDSFQIVNGNDILYKINFQADTTPRNFSGSFVIRPIENQQYGFNITHLDDSGTSVLNITTLTTKIIQTAPEFNGSSSLTVLSPYVPNFDYNEYNVLLNNADIPRKSIYFMDVDYSQNPVTPVNQSLILSGSADRAYVQDSNYTSQAWSTIRYRGSKYTSIKPSI